VIRILTWKYVARLRRQPDLEIHGSTSPRSRRRIYVETKHKDDASCVATELEDQRSEIRDYE
jgi:hypothetical protein